MDLSQRPLQLAVALSRAGAEVVMVGGAARRLNGLPHRPADLDVVVAPEGTIRLVDALRVLGVDSTSARLLRSGCSRLETSYGPLDVFVGALPAAETLGLDGVAVRVAT